MDTARKAAEEAGRDPAQLKCIVGAPSHVTDDLADAREQVRWFPAMVSNHVMDLIERYGTDGSSVPKALTDYVQARKFYDYNEHSRVGAKHGEFVTDEICDRFCVLGNDRPDQGEAEGARGRRRRPVQHLPDDPRPGGDAPGLRGRDHLRLRRRHCLTTLQALLEMRQAVPLSFSPDGSGCSSARTSGDATAVRAACAGRRARAADDARRAGLRAASCRTAGSSSRSTRAATSARSCTCSRTTAARAARRRSALHPPDAACRRARARVLDEPAQRRRLRHRRARPRDRRRARLRARRQLQRRGVSPDGRCIAVERVGRAERRQRPLSLRRADRRGRRI